MRSAFFCLTYYYAQRIFHLINRAPSQSTGQPDKEMKMAKTFAALKAEAVAATDNVSLFSAVDEANTKLFNNIAKAKLLSFTHGAAADADHYFQNVIPGWQRIVDEINAIWTRAVSGKPADEIVKIIIDAKSPSAA